MAADLAPLERAADGSLPEFTEAVLATDDWLANLRGLFSRPGFARRALALLERAGVGACAPLPSRVRNVVEMLGQQLGTAGYEPAFDLVVKRHREHPNREVRIYVGHGLSGFGARGIDALAGPPGSEPGDSEHGVNLIRMRAA